MTKTEEVVAELKNTTVAQVVRQCIAIIATLTSVWLFVGTWVEAYADNIFEKMMTKQGVSPKVFKEMGDKVQEIDKKTDGMKNDLDVVKGQNRELQGQGEDLKASQEETKKLVEKLLDLQLRRNRNGARIPGENPQ